MRTDRKTFCFQLRDISPWELVDFPWLSPESPGFLFIANHSAPTTSTEHISSRREPLQGAPRTGRDRAAGWYRSSNHRLNIPCFAFRWLCSTPGRHASQAGNHTSLLILLGSKGQPPPPPGPPLKELGWILESTPPPPPPTPASCL